MPRARPVAWTPPTDRGLVGSFAVNDRLAGARLVAVPGAGPEDVVVRPDGRLTFGLADGRVVESRPDGSDPRLLADTGGRPLGLEQHPDGRLIVCDADRGLLAVGDGGVEVLADSFEGERFRFTNNAAVTSEGTVYFTVTSRRFGIHDYRQDVLEHSNTGRLFRWDPSGELELVVDGLSFANGVALSSDEAFVFFTETGEYRLNRLAVDGSSGRETVAENLPGIPDNLTSNGRGTIWMALFTPRNRMLDMLLPRPRLRAAIGRLPEAIQPQPVRHGFVVGFDEQTGEVVANLQDPEGHYAPVTTAREHEGRLWLGSLTEGSLAVLEL